MGDIAKRLYTKEKSSKAKLFIFVEAILSRGPSITRGLFHVDSLITFLKNKKSNCKANVERNGPCLTLELT